MTRLAKPGWQLEQHLWQQGCTHVAGLDEAGRGALAGPVIVAAVVLPQDLSEAAYDNINDSKTITEVNRGILAAHIKTIALSWAVGLATAQEVDTHNVLAATHLAAKRALDVLEAITPLDGLVTDYLKLSRPYAVLAPAKADSSSLQVAAASILAKTSRDAFMRRAHEHHPPYQFVSNKGYGSSHHLAALHDHGPCPLHRRTFKPVAECLLAHDPLGNFGTSDDTVSHISTSLTDD
ncbi:MAG: ribonuclease HII [Deinococcota bacterium]